MSETQLLLAIRETVNLLPGCRARRNNSGALRDRFGRLIRYGLGTGSPDLLCEVSLQCVIVGGPMVVLARAAYLEVKLPGERPTSDQLAWHDEARRRGVFVAVVHSTEEALAAVERCRVGAVS